MKILSKVREQKNSYRSKEESEIFQGTSQAGFEEKKLFISLKF